MQIPIIDAWCLTPALSYGGIGSIDLGSVSQIVSGTLTSRYTHDIVKHDAIPDMHLTFGNMVGKIIAYTCTDYAALLGETYLSVINDVITFKECRASAAWNDGLRSLKLSTFLCYELEANIALLCEIYSLIINDMLIISSGNYVALFVQKRRSYGKVDDTRLRQLFSLTLTEAIIATELAMGKTLLEIQQSRHCSQSTIRNQLKSVFYKTGVQQQSQLVSLVKILLR